MTRWFPSLRIVLWALAGGISIALLKVLEYRHLVHSYPTELYGGLIAVLFAALGIYAGLRWSRSRETEVVREIRVPVEEFELDEAPSPTFSSPSSRCFPSASS